MRVRRYLDAAAGLEKQYAADATFYAAAVPIAHKARVQRQIGRASCRKRKSVRAGYANFVAVESPDGETAIVVASVPFDGAAPISISEAIRRAAAAIEAVTHEQRENGRPISTSRGWRQEKTPGEWSLYARPHTVPRSAREIGAALESNGARNVAFYRTASIEDQRDDGPPTRGERVTACTPPAFDHWSFALENDMTPEELRRLRIANSTPPEPWDGTAAESARAETVAKVHHHAPPGYSVGADADAWRRLEAGITSAEAARNVAAHRAALEDYRAGALALFRRWGSAAGVRDAPAA